MTWQRWLVVAAVPTVSFVVGAIAMPHPKPVSAEKETVDRDALGAAVSTIRPSPKTPIDAQLGDAVKVLGSDLPTASLSRGGPISFRTYFECTGDLDKDWMIFVHVDAHGGSYRIHGDHNPVHDKYPTTFWKAGDYIADDWASVVPRDAPAGVYDVWIGFYSGEERLEWSGGNPTAHDGANRIKLGSIVIE